MTIVASDSAASAPVSAAAAPISATPPTSAPSLNAITPAPVARRPRFRIMNGGQPMPGVIKVEVENVSHYHADSFTAEFALYSDTIHNIGWWEFQKQGSLMVDIQVGLLQAGQSETDAPSWVSLIQGEVDHVQIHPQTGVVTIQGRDLSSLFIEAKTQEAFVNQTSSQIAATLAGRHPEITKTDIQATTTLIQRYYEDEHDHVTHDQLSKTTTEWDLLVFLAQREGYNVWVTGSTLHFRKPPDVNSTPWMIHWVPPTKDTATLATYGQKSNIIQLSLERSLVIAKDIIVKVRSWSSEKGKGYTKTAKGIHTQGMTSTKSTTQSYSYTFPDLTEAQAQDRANQILKDLTQFERTISWSEPGSLILNVMNIVKLDGTGSGFDQIYYLESIKRSISFDGGFTMDCKAKNSSPMSITQV